MAIKGGNPPPPPTFTLHLSCLAVYKFTDMVYSNIYKAAAYASGIIIYPIWNASLLILYNVHYILYIQYFKFSKSNHYGQIFPLHTSSLGLIVHWTIDVVPKPFPCSRVLLQIDTTLHLFCWPYWSVWNLIRFRIKGLLIYSAKKTIFCPAVNYIQYVQEVVTHLI